MSDTKTRVQIEEYTAPPHGEHGPDLRSADFPRSWYQIAWSQEIEECDVRPLHYFDRELVLFRGGSGRLTVLDAYCGHLGAHLGHGGTIVDDDIVCPFHAWRWDGAGRNVDIPYSSRRCNRAVQMRSYPVMEQDGLVLVWYDPAGLAPEWVPGRLKEFSDADFYPLVPHGMMKRWSGVHFHPQHVLENSADPAHLKYVHKNASVPAVLRHEADGPTFHFAFDATYRTPERDEVPGEIPGVWWGMGILGFGLEGVHNSAEYLTVTPIDHRRSDMRISVVARRVADADTPEGTEAERVMRHQIKEVDRDLAIWDHMHYSTNPTLAVEEVKLFNAIRAWSSQFDVDADDD